MVFFLVYYKMHHSHVQFLLKKNNFLSISISSHLTQDPSIIRASYDGERSFELDLIITPRFRTREGGEMIFKVKWNWFVRRSLTWIQVDFSSPKAL